MKPPQPKQWLRMNGEPLWFQPRKSSIGSFFSPLGWLRCLRSKTCLMAPPLPFRPLVI
jgi:hypothetical protein